VGRRRCLCAKAGNDDREDRHLATDHRCECVGRDIKDESNQRAQCEYREAEGSECDRRGVGQQGQRSGEERAKPSPTMIAAVIMRETYTFPIGL
jgi:hypothetical protein